MDDSSDGQTTREGSSMDQELCLVWLYCVMDGTLRSMIGTGRLRRRGPEPDLTDAEVLTLQIWGEVRGLASDAAIWRDATANLCAEPRQSGDFAPAEPVVGARQADHGFLSQWRRVHRLSPAPKRQAATSSRNGTRRRRASYEPNRMPASPNCPRDPRRAA